METAKILIVDDDLGMCDSVGQLLSSNGYQVQKCYDALEALEYLSKDEFDIVLLDIYMPVMDGYQLIDSIKQNIPESVIIVMTGMASLESVVVALRKGVYDYLRKPFEPAELLKTIENALINKELKSLKNQTEDALKKSEKRFRDLVENSLVGVCIVQNGRIIYMNPEQKRLFGTLPESFDFKALKIHLKDTIKFDQYCKFIYEHEAPSNDMELRFLPFYDETEKTSPIWVNCRTSIIEYQGDKAILINMVDISKSKELEKRIIIREKMASLGNMAVSIAHEIRNPLSGISLLLDCLADSFDSPIEIETAQDLINQAKGSVTKIESVIDRILNFSRPNKHNLEYKDINIPIQEAIHLSYPALKKSGVDIQLDLAEGLPYIYLDSQLIEQTLLNLINNAADAMGSSKKKLLKITSLKEGGDIVLRISDSGEGIRPENIEKIFDPFFTTKMNGSGIGLSFCERIITEHGGSIKVHSSMGAGAEFLIRIPLEKRAISR